jgi:DNA-binding NarL/FixJ family response regulator
MAEYAAQPGNVRILVADGAELVRRGIRDVLASDRRFQVVGELERPRDIVDACLDLSPDIIFLGMAEGSDNGAAVSESLTALRQTLRLDPYARVIVLVDGETADGLLQPLQAGARGAFLRDAPATRLLEAIGDVLEGGGALDSRLARSLFDYLAFNNGLPITGAWQPELRLDPAALRPLSRREQEVLRALARGHRNKEIAGQLGVSVGTVKTHLRHIFRKLSVPDRTAAVLAALQGSLREAA